MQVNEHEKELKRALVVSSSFFGCGYLELTTTLEG
jgi:hypothetical protein